MQVPILNGVYTDSNADFRASYPRNMQPVLDNNGISAGYLRPSEGIELLAIGPGVDRGGVNWNNMCYRVMGSKLCRVGADGTITQLGDVANDGKQVSFDYSFDRLAIAASGQLFFTTGGALTRVVDPDLGAAKSVIYVDGYFMTTDGNYLVVTDLDDPTSVNSLKYGSAEIDPDPIKRILKVRNEPAAVGRYSIEFYANTGGNLFPFQRIPGAYVPRGSIGEFSCCVFNGAVAFVGSARNEPPAVWVGSNGQSVKLSTREVDLVLQQYSDSQLENIVIEARVDSNMSLLLIHLHDQTLVYDATGTQLAQGPVWYTLDSGVVAKATYRMRNLVWCNGKWLGGDPTSNNLGAYTTASSHHYGDVIGWEFGTSITYADGRGAIFHELELVALTGRVKNGEAPVIWTSYTLDGVTWSQERQKAIGSQGSRNTRICWLQQGTMRHWRAQKFRGSSEAFASFARLEVKLEVLNV